MQMPVMETRPILSALDPHIRPVRRTRRSQVPVGSRKFIAGGLMGKPPQSSRMWIIELGGNSEIRHESQE